MATIEQGNGSQISEEAIKAQFGKYLTPKPRKDAVEKGEISLEELLATFEKEEPRPHNAPMTEITREELNAKLEATTAKVDARLASIENTVRETLAAIRQDSADVRREMGELRGEMGQLRGDIGQQIGNFRGDLGSVSGDLKAVNQELAGLKNLKGNIWGGVLAVVLAVVGAGFTIYFGIKSDNQMLVSNAISSFGAGRDVATVQAGITQQAQALQQAQDNLAKQASETQALLKQINEKLEARSAESPPAAAGKRSK
ncbi:hypothetical protein [Pseudomonas sp. B1-22]|uniref:hypothetical protein n=1 Tax=Pseudomonas sp. B1-22 TaxID=3141456 RepID=UPI003D26829C